MRGRFSVWATAAVLAAGFSACTSVHPAASAPPEPPAGQCSRLPATEMESGRTLYLAKCGRCHKFYDPAKYPAKDWREWMDKMSRKAKLKLDQKALLSKYLDLYRRETRTNPPIDELSGVSVERR